jgi:hypothetical protein
MRGIFPVFPRKKIIRTAKELCMYPDTIPPKIFPCGAIAKKKQTQNIYNDARSIGDHSFYL